MKTTGETEPPDAHQHDIDEFEKLRAKFEELRLQDRREYLERIRAEAVYATDSADTATNATRLIEASAEQRFLVFRKWWRRLALYHTIVWMGDVFSATGALLVLTYDLWAGYGDIAAWTTVPFFAFLTVTQFWMLFRGKRIIISQLPKTGESHTSEQLAQKIEEIRRVRARGLLFQISCLISWIAVLSFLAVLCRGDWRPLAESLSWQPLADSMSWVSLLPGPFLIPLAFLIPGLVVLLHFIRFNQINPLSMWCYGDAQLEAAARETFSNARLARFLDWIARKLSATTRNVVPVLSAAQYYKAVSYVCYAALIVWLFSRTAGGGDASFFYLKGILILVAVIMIGVANMAKAVAENEPIDADDEWERSVRESLGFIKTADARREREARSGDFDVVTGLVRREKLMASLRQTIADLEGKIPGVELSLVVVDIKNYWEFGKTAGWQAADELLSLAAAILSRSVRERASWALKTVVARFGGGTMMILVVGCSRSRAMDLRNDIKSDFEDCPVRLRDGTELTIPIGEASVSTDEFSPDQIDVNSLGARLVDLASSLRRESEGLALVSSGRPSSQT